MELRFSAHLYEAGIDEAGRGCLAGPVVAAAVILPDGFEHPILTDSKKLSHDQRMNIRPYILEHAIAWGVGMKSASRIDEINILQANFEAMHEAIEALGQEPSFISIDGNKFKPFEEIPFECVVKGDAKYTNIAAASILAKTYRDEVMVFLHEKYPEYGWDGNKGYPTKKHKIAIREHGPSPFHRQSFNWKLPED
ncbi:MAG: ribonuclease HII [Bacteroidia bacterium]|nr:ribonuclease HII [Bacteroidia bacterium]